MKRIIISFVSIICFTNIYGQCIITDSLPQVFIISLVKCSDFVMVQPKNEEKETRFNVKKGIELSSFVTYKDSVIVKYKNKKIKNAKYEFLGDNCFLIFDNTEAIYKYILPIVNDTLQDKIKTKYFHPFAYFGVTLSEKKEYKNFYFRNIENQEFLLVLVKATLLNEIYSKYLPKRYRLKKEFCYNGIYVKMLIPL